MGHLVVIDLETSGVNPNKHSVLEIGVCPLDKNIKPFHVYVRSHNIIWSDFARKNFSNFSSEWEDKSVSPKEAVTMLGDYFAKFFGGQKVTAIGHNIGFDMSFLKKIAYEAGLDEIPFLSHRALDTHTLLYLLYKMGRIPEAALSSDGAFSFFEINVAKGKRHTAIGDAEATKKMVIKIFDNFGVDLNL